MARMIPGRRYQRSTLSDGCERTYSVRESDREERAVANELGLRREEEGGPSVHRVSSDETKGAELRTYEAPTPQKT
jgi:hypothetical protein